MGHINCPRCQARLTVPESPGPLTVRCPTCRFTFRTEGGNVKEAVPKYDSGRGMTRSTKGILIGCGAAAAGLMAGLIWITASGGDPGAPKPAPTKERGRAQALASEPLPSSTADTDLADTSDPTADDSEWSDPSATDVATDYTPTPTDTWDNYSDQDNKPKKRAKRAGKGKKGGGKKAGANKKGGKGQKASGKKDGKGKKASGKKAGANKKGGSKKGKKKAKG